MRSGLVVVGLVIAVVGAAVLVTIVIYPPMTQETSITSTTKFGTALANSTTGGRPASFGWAPASAVFLTWTGNSSVSAAFYDAKGCPAFNNTTGTCSGGAPLASWSGSAGATYSNATPIQCPCYLVLVDPHTFDVSVVAILAEFHVNTSPALTTFTYVSAFFGSIILLVIGGVAVFLGFFLRGGVYRGGVVGDDDPDLADIDDWDGPPPGPPT